MDRIDRQELLDEPGHAPEDVEASLRDVQRVNRFLGGTAVTLGHLRRRIRKLPPGSSLLLLDLATGSGDIPRSVVHWGRSHGYRLRYVGLDANPAVLETARRQSRDYPEIDYVLGDARRAGLADGRFDYVTCSLALHHFGPEEAAQILREMDRLCSRGLIVNDLRRSRVAYSLIWALTRLLRAHPLTRHDGPVSTLRAYTPPELRELARAAGLPNPRVHKHPFYRMALTADKP